MAPAPRMICNSDDHSARGRATVRAPKLRPLDERGIGLAEVVASTLIATLAVIGLAYSFGIGRGLIDRYQVARLALSRAQLLVDSLGTRRPGELLNGSQPFWLPGNAPPGIETWVITPVDDPIDGTQAMGTDDQPVDLQHIHVVVSWRLGGAVDSMGLDRIVLAP